MKRRKASVVRIGRVAIGGTHPVAIQSMTKVPTSDLKKMAEQVRTLELAGCEIIRVSVRDGGDADAVRRIKSLTRMPVVADIHFDWRLAMTAIGAGADKIRLNPGNINKKEQVREVAAAARDRKIPIRVGLNSGSIGGSAQGQARRMAMAALSYARLLENFGFSDIVLSLKANNVVDTVNAYRMVASQCQYPLHLGVTATGPKAPGLIKSSAAIGALLLEGIGDTIRISLTEPPDEEVRAARCLLGSLGLRPAGTQIIACPTCGRCRVNLMEIVNGLEGKLADMDTRGRSLSVAVMGCEVNGPGEARMADIGAAFGTGQALLFKKGKALRKVSSGACADELLKEVKLLLKVP